MSKDTKYQVSIVIDGESAKKLFAIGPNEILNFLLPTRLDVATKDVEHVIFQENLSPEETVKVILGKKTTIEHKDNYFRKEK